MSTATGQSAGNGIGGNVDFLADGGAIKMPYGATFWSKGFGMCEDKFGIPWMVNCAMEP